MGLVLTTGVQGIIVVIISLSPEGLYKTSLNFQAIGSGIQDGTRWTMCQRTGNWAKTE